jgi:integrase
MGMLRKWGSTHLIANRLPVNAVQERLGHSRPDIVLIHYARLLDESAVAAAASVEFETFRAFCGAGKCWF